MGKHISLKFGLSVLVVLSAIVWPLAAAATGILSPPIQSPVAPTFGPMTFTTEFDARNMRPVGSKPALDLGISHFYAYTTFQGALAGAPAKAYGYFTLPFVGQEVLFYESESRLQTPDGVWWEQIVNKDGGPLPAGSYRVVFEIDGQAVVEGETVVGVASKPLAPIPAQPPVPTPAQPPTETPLRATPTPIIVTPNRRK